MRRFLKILSLILAMITVASCASLFAFADDADNIITVGKGGKYATIAEAIAGETTDGLDGKTIKLVSNVSVKSTKFDSSKNPTIVVDGDGHSVSMGTGFVCIGVNITFKNMNATQTAANHPFIYARGNSDVTVENCTTDDTFKYVFALHGNGNCRLTVNSGSYSASQKVFNLDPYNNTEKTRSVVTVNGGCFWADGGNIASISANTQLDINGGLFYTETKAPMIVDTKFKLAGTTNQTAVKVSGASFIYPTDGMGLFGENSDDTAAVNMTADATVELFAVIDGSTDGTCYKAEYTSANNSFAVLDNVKAVSSEGKINI